jgi:hypothetical protein
MFKTCDNTAYTEHNDMKSHVWPKLLLKYPVSCNRGKPNENIQHEGELNVLK